MNNPHALYVNGEFVGIITNTDPFTNFHGLICEANDNGEKLDVLTIPKNMGNTEQWGAFSNAVEGLGVNDTIYVSGLTYEYDHDENENTTHAEGTVTIYGADDVEEARQMLISGDADTESKFGNRYVSFIPYEVNGEEVEEGNAGHCWVTDACLDHLKRNPDCREFRLEGNVE